VLSTLLALRCVTAYNVSRCLTVVLLLVDSAVQSTAYRTALWHCFYRGKYTKELIKCAELPLAACHLQRCQLLLYCNSVNMKQLLFTLSSSAVLYWCVSRSSACFASDRATTTAGQSRSTGLQLPYDVDHTRRSVRKAHHQQYTPQFEIMDCVTMTDS
jgi:hypothetical protein